MANNQRDAIENVQRPQDFYRPAGRDALPICPAGGDAHAYEREPV